MCHTLKHLLQVQVQVQVQIIFFSLKGNEFAIQWAKNQCNSLKIVCARLTKLKKCLNIFSEKGNLFSKVYSMMAQSLSDMV